MAPKFVSLYSGCGGMDLGFKRAGFECINAFDFDKNAIQTHLKNVSQNAKLVDLGKNDDSVVSQIKKADVLIAGPPCQGFSTAGKNDPNDERNTHLKKVAILASKAKPKIVVIENVKGLLSKNNTHHFNSTISTLESAGYSVSWDILNSADYGVPQNRHRVVILGVLSSEKYELNLMCKPRKAIGDVLLDLPTPIEKILSEESVDLKIAKRIMPGQKLSNVRGGTHSVHTWEIPEVFGSVTNSEISFLETIVKLRRQKRRRGFGDADPVEIATLQKNFNMEADQLIESLLEKCYLRRIASYIDLTQTFNGKYRRLLWDQAAPTVDTRFGQAKYFLHPKEHRGFSVREAARIQSFPDYFQFSGSDSVAYKLIGNAVPPVFAETIAVFVRKIWSTL